MTYARTTTAIVMACRVLASSIPYTERQQVNKKCTVKLKPARFGRGKSVWARSVKCFQSEYDDVGREILYLPKMFDQQLSKYLLPEHAFTDVKYPPNPIKLYDGDDQLDLPPDRRRDQKQVYEEIMMKLRDYGSCLLSASTSYGKTKTATCCAIDIKLKTMIVCHSRKVREQWITEFEDIGVAVQQKGIPDPDYDVYVYGPMELKKYSYDQLKDIGFLIMDEIHTHTERSVSDIMLRMAPRFLLGLSATPDRKNGLDAAFGLYYGSKSLWITRILKKDFVAYQVTTGITLGELPKSANGTVPLSTVLREVYSYEDFHDILYKLIGIIGDRRCMVMFGLVKDGADLFCDYLQEKDETDFCRYCGDDSTYEKKKILVTTDRKCGYGFDDPGISVLFFVHSTLDIRQAEGRARGNNYFIFDLIHNRVNLKEHAKARKEWYLSRGGIVVHLHHTEHEKMNTTAGENGEWIGLTEEEEQPL